MLLRHIFGPSEYQTFFSISAVFEVLGKVISIFFELFRFFAFRFSLSFARTQPETRPVDMRLSCPFESFGRSSDTQRPSDFFLFLYFSLF